MFEQPVALRRRVFEQLRHQLLRGQLAPGTRLVETKLAAALGVSRTPIREALHLLELEGLLESRPRVGYRVRSVAWEEVEDVMALRVANETLAARWACERISPEGIAALEQNVLESERALAQGTTDTFLDLDALFHEILASGSGSKRLLDICQTLRRHMLLFRLVSLADAHMVGLAVGGHRRILEAVKRRDAGAASRAMAEHLGDARSSIRSVAGWESDPQT